MAAVKVYLGCMYCSEDEDGKKFKCSSCNKNACLQCHKLDFDDSVLCEPCHRNRFPKDYEYSFEIPKSDDKTSVVRLTNRRLDGIKEAYNACKPMSVKVQPNWTASRIIKAFRDSELVKFASTADVEKYGYGFVLSYYLEPFDDDVKKIIDAFKEKGYYYTLCDVYYNKDEKFERMLYLKLWKEDPRGNPKFSRIIKESSPHRVIYSNIE
jgi:hypothetical protein